jgi:membrane-associated phospholipid phosphatase
MNGKAKFHFRKTINILDHYDKKISSHIHELEIHHKCEHFIYLIARLFNPDFILSYLFIIFIHSIYSHSDYYFVLKPIIHTIFALLVTLSMKKITARPRPNVLEKIKRKYNLRQHEKNCSMPSGDSLQSANYAMILFLYYNTYIGIFLIPFVMFSRIFYSCHFILDTVVGSLLGLAISYGIFLTIN